MQVSVQFTLHFHVVTVKKRCSQKLQINYRLVQDSLSKHLYIDKGQPVVALAINYWYNNFDVYLD